MQRFRNLKIIFLVPGNIFRGIDIQCPVHENCLELYVSIGHDHLELLQANFYLIQIV